MSPPSTIPTWLWVVGGLAVTGIVGFAAYTAYAESKPETKTQSNPLPAKAEKRKLRRHRRRRVTK